MKNRFLILIVLFLLFINADSKDKKDNMIFVKGGTFDMGDKFGDEFPVHKETVKDFRIGKYEVTVGEFKEFINDTGYMTLAERAMQPGYKYMFLSALFFGYDEKNGFLTNIRGSSWKDPGFKQEDDHPVVCISWYDALKYCNWKSKKEGLKEVYIIDETNIDLKNNNEFDHYKWIVGMDNKANGYRLPTEAEWEYAARNGGKKIKYAWGNSDMPVLKRKKHANVADETGKQIFKDWVIFEKYNDGYIYTSPVGKFEPNEFGLYDMTGNVWEWCLDSYKDYKLNQSDTALGVGIWKYRINRGGSWDCRPVNSRVSNRSSSNADIWLNTLGFRIVIDGKN